jgi:hypothetical protein
VTDVEETGYSSKFAKKYSINVRYLTNFQTPSSTITADAKFKQLVRDMQTYSDVANWAYLQGGGFQGFDAISDTRKIRESNTLVYIGEKSKSFAIGLSHTMKLDIVSAAELRERMKAL